jgi:hypothetical protein
MRAVGYARLSRSVIERSQDEGWTIAVVVGIDAIDHHRGVVADGHLLRGQVGADLRGDAGDDQRLGAALDFGPRSLSA